MVFSVQDHEKLMADLELPGTCSKAHHFWYLFVKFWGCICLKNHPLDLVCAWWELEIQRVEPCDKNDVKRRLFKSLGTGDWWWRNTSEKTRQVEVGSFYSHIPEPFFFNHRRMINQKVVKLLLPWFSFWFCPKLTFCLFESLNQICEIGKSTSPPNIPSSEIVVESS